MSPNKDEEYVQQIRDALTHLYDHAYLQRHPLAERLVPPQIAATRTRGQELRRILLDAIEALRPADNVPVRDIERRPYAILFGIYVEGGERREVANSLGISGRQLRRDRNAAFEALASILHDRYLAGAGREAQPPASESLRVESERLAQQREPVELYDVVEGVLPLLEPVARKFGVHLISGVRPGLPRPYANRTLVRQVLIKLAGQALALLPLARLSFAARPAEMQVGVGLEFDYSQPEIKSPAEVTALAPALQAAETLAEALGARLVRQPDTGRPEQVWVMLPLQTESMVLVVDDNQELFALFQRYLAGQPYQLVHAASVPQALALAQSLRPDMITLDLMLPEQDGWELLQALRTQPDVAQIPVIVCSVLYDPDLALTLGAQLYLKKPVGAADLLQALETAKALASVEAGHRE